MSPEGPALHSHSNQYKGFEAQERLHRQLGASGQQAKIGDDPHGQAVPRSQVAAHPGHLPSHGEDVFYVFRTLSHFR